MAAMSPRRLVPLKSGFTPRSVAGLFAWWDFSDAASLTLNSGNISQANDKSGNGRHAYSLFAAQQPASTVSQNGRKAAVFTGSQFLQAGSSASAWKFMHYGSDRYAMFVVLKRNELGLSSTEWAISTGTANANTVLGMELSSQAYSISGSALTGVYYVVLNSPIAVDEAYASDDVLLSGTLADPLALAVMGDPSANNTNAVRLYDHRGTADAPIYNGSNVDADPPGPLILGGYTNTDDEPQGHWVGWIGEVIVYKAATAMPEVSRVRLLNYLKSKWGLS